MTSRHRWFLPAAASSFVVLGLACVDLFHGTEFETLCIHSPDDPACTGDAAIDVDAAAEAAPRPHPDFCAWSSSEARKQALRACAWLGACEGPLGEAVFGPCAVRAQLAYDCKAAPSVRPQGAVDEFWGCLATVRSCGDVDGCVFPGGVQSCVAVPTGSSSACGTLAGNTATRLKCAGPAGRAVGVEPCVMLGKTCAAESTSVASCVGSLGFTCATTGCSGTKAVDCRTAGTRKLDRGVDCAGYGAGACVDGAGGPACKGGPTAPSCSTDPAPRCNADLLTTCIDGRDVQIDCTKLGLRCDVSQAVALYDPAAGCVDRPGACSGPDKCVGNKLQSCARGSVYEVDCADVGLGPCKIDASGNGACSRL